MNASAAPLLMGRVGGLTAAGADFIELLYGLGRGVRMLIKKGLRDAYRGYATRELRNLGKAPGKGYSPHHIVEVMNEKWPSAISSRKILRDFKIKVNSGPNCAGSRYSRGIVSRSERGFKRVPHRFGAVQGKLAALGAFGAPGPRLRDVAWGNYAGKEGAFPATPRANRDKQPRIPANNVIRYTNGVWMKNGKGGAHAQTYGKAYSDWVNKQLTGAQTRDEALEILDDIRETLTSMNSGAKAPWK